MNIKSLIESFTTIHSAVTTDFSVTNKRIVRSLVSKYSCGNTNLQLGRFSTEKEITNRKRQVCNYKFSD